MAGRSARCLIPSNKPTRAAAGEATPIAGAWRPKSWRAGSAAMVATLTPREAPG